MDFVEDDGGRLVDAEDAHEEGEEGDEAEGRPVGGGEVEDVVVLYAGGGVVVGWVRGFVGRGLDHCWFSGGAIWCGIFLR